MPVLAGYNQFEGIQWDTGPIRNALDYQGLVAPHSGKPLSEALLLGISGGLAAGYFVFEYEGHAPHLHFLTRNTFEPMQAVLTRLRIGTGVKHATTPEKGVANLVGALAEGKPAIVWADMASLPYNNLRAGADMWMMMPILVYGYDQGANQVLIADRARVPLPATTGELAEARSRIAKERYRVMTLTPPDLGALPGAVEEGIRNCLSLFLDEPPRKPMKGKFGLDAFTKWADLLTDPKDSKGWAKQFAPGPRMYAGLSSAYRYTHLWWTGGNGARGIYADFLDEAAAILGKPALRECASLYRGLNGRWAEFLRALLPDEVGPLGEARRLMQREYDLFVEQGAGSLAERQAIAGQLRAISDQMRAEFPLSDAQAAAMREGLRVHLLGVHDAEREAIQSLRAAMA